MSIGNDIELCPLCDGQRGDVNCPICQGRGRAFTWEIDEYESHRMEGTVEDTKVRKVTNHDTP